MQASFHDAVARAAPAVAGSASAIKRQVVGDLIDIAIAAAAGYFTDLVLPDRPFESLDEIDFRAWLIQHGAIDDQRLPDRPAVVQRIPVRCSLRLGCYVREAVRAGGAPGADLPRVEHGHPPERL
jgi:hypothetical protein